MLLEPIINGLRAVRGFESARRGKSKVSLYIRGKTIFFLNEHGNF